ncbi:phosphatase PAP2 family protein, partial [Patescibacteria group bacterium]|nr:phosphatase PAP2 family protein [Patescibacteria group bacterium]MBU4017294.1 phosphatase PAP2 family protein [Patescibacteria group bacterium]
MSKRISFFLCGAFLFLVFVFFSYLVHKDIFTQFDFDTTVRLQNNISRRLDTIFSAFSDIGKFEIMLVLLVAIFAVVRRVLAGFIAIILFFGFHLFELFGKFYVDHTPPPQFMLRTETVFDFPQFHIRADNSYPSGHAGRTMFLSTILLVLIWQARGLNNPLKLFLSICIIGFDIVMLVSRVYLGEHWTTDVIGGSVLGMALGLFSGIFVMRRSKVKRK